VATPSTESAPRPESGLLGRGVTAELLSRYDRPGPRYTSYPTAVELEPGFAPHRYEALLDTAAERADEPLSVYVHIPFCESRCVFCGCHVIVSPHKERVRPYLDLLRREAAMLAESLGGRRRLSQLHLGGGTPTYFSPEELSGFVRDLLGHFEPVPGAELAVEVDPRVTTTEHVDALAEVGFNRLSAGVQDFSPGVQEAIGRAQSLEQTARVVERARERGFSGLNVDLVYGLPRQDMKGFEATVDTIVSLRADRVAVYSFAYVPWIRGHQKQLRAEEMPGREEKLALFAMARERFLDAGYEAIGMDHFARPEDELARARREGRLRRNFQGYTVLPGTDVLGLGISAIGDVSGALVQNEKKLGRYRRAVEAGRLPVERGLVRSQDDKVRENVIHELMCNFHVDVRAVERRFELRFTDYFAPDLEQLRVHEGEGLVRIGPERIEVTEVGQLFVRNLAMCFDRYWREKHATEGRPVFSRTV